MPVEHGLRLLRRGGVVEIDERLAVDLHRQDREVRADAGDVVERAHLVHGGLTSARAVSQAAT
jgi:hypothetical protein